MQYLRRHRSEMYRRHRPEHRGQFLEFTRNALSDGRCSRAATLP
ncbi:hypothetical protein NXX09_23925 [Bacteroides uniformis]|nr:hypothetical protein [Bacteroides uniformis]